MHSNSISFPQKRQRSGSSAEISQGSKRKSSHPPVAYWDNLSKIWLTAESLRELDRRTSSAPGFQHAELKKEHLHFAPDFLRDCSPTRLREIKSLAASGGPDLTGLRNSKGLPEPNNMEEVRKILARPRDSQITRSNFLKFKRVEARASKEKGVTSLVIPILDGEMDDDPKCVGGDYPFSNLAPLTDGTLPAAKPDHHFGARPEDLNRQIRDELNHYIVPSTQSDLAMLQNFF
uniref:Uncharacterized protein n=1 Tax=Talaromyces marneffei PM1 TaxID=1077442 RepID=A0A093V8N1_TALMA